MNKTLDYITKLLSIPSPTGDASGPINYINKELVEVGYEPIITEKGSLLVTVKGDNDDRHRLVTAHIDTLGAMVKEIKPSGRIKLDLIGGFAYNSIEGENCTIHLMDGKTLTGTIQMHQSSVHVYKNVRTAERNQDNMEIRLDEKVFSREDTEKLGVRVGDFISFDPRTVLTESGFLKSRHLDDKVSAGILLNQLMKIKSENIKLPVTTHFYFSNNEELGYGANSNIPSQTVDYIAVDMGAIGDGQATDEYSVSICAKDSSGPYNKELKDQMDELAEKNNIDYKLDIYPYYASDASAALRSGHDIRHALFGAGIESSHSYERTHIDSIKATEDLFEVLINSEII